MSQGYTNTSATIALSAAINPGLAVSGNLTSSSDIYIRGNAKIDGDITFRGGQSLGDVLDKIQQRLNILVPNPELELEYEQLHQLRIQYIELERELLKKQQVFDILNKK